jgi:hypothetical protein
MSEVLDVLQQGHQCCQPELSSDIDTLQTILVKFELHMEGYASWEGQEACRARALALRCCAFPLCTNLAGASEAALRSRNCSRCMVAAYCSTACQRADWARHKRVCKQLAQQRGRGEQAAGSEAEQ